MTKRGLTRRNIGGLAAGAALSTALTAGSMRTAQAADATTFVSGFALPGNLDPHQVYDAQWRELAKATKITVD